MNKLDVFMKYVDIACYAIVYVLNIVEYLPCMVVRPFIGMSSNMKAGYDSAKRRLAYNSYKLYHMFRA